MCVCVCVCVCVCCHRAARKPDPAPKIGLGTPLESCLFCNRSGCQPTTRSRSETPLKLRSTCDIQSKQHFQFRIDICGATSLRSSQWCAHGTRLFDTHSMVLDIWPVWIVGRPACPRPPPGGPARSDRETRHMSSCARLLSKARDVRPWATTGRVLVRGARPRVSRAPQGRTRRGANCVSCMPCFSLAPPNQTLCQDQHGL